MSTVDFRTAVVEKDPVKKNRLRATFTFDRACEAYDFFDEFKDRLECSVPFFQRPDTWIVLVWL